MGRKIRSRHLFIHILFLINLASNLRSGSPRIVKARDNASSTVDSKMVLIFGLLQQRFRTGLLNIY